MDDMTVGFVETPLLFGRHRSLVGVGCEPDRGSKPGKPCVVFINSGIVHRAGPNRVYVRLARALAQTGTASLRFDLSGIGDSWVSPDAGPLSARARVVQDIDDALERAAAWWGADTFVVVGLCSGADNALRTIGRRSDVVGAVLLDLNVPRNLGFHLRRVVSGLSRVESWRNVLTGQHPVYDEIKSVLGIGDGGDGAAPPAEGVDLEHDAWLPKEEMREQFERVLDRRAQLLCIFTAGLDAYNHRDQLVNSFRDLDFEGALQLEFFEDSDHTFSRRFLQERLIKTICRWMQETSFDRAD